MKGMGFIRMGSRLKKIIIHIGMPKTGSSAIQALLALNKDYFAHQGVAFPWHDGFTQSYQTSGGNAELLLKWMSSHDRSAFDQAISALNETTVVISSESLFYTFKRDPHGFFDFFAGYDFTVVCYARDLVQLVDSSLNQAVKNHGFLVSDEHLNHIIEDCHYMDILHQVAKYVESGRLVVRWYDKAQFGPQGIYADFLRSIDLDVDFNQLTFPNKIVNPSLSPDAFSFRCLLNSCSALSTNHAFKYQLNALLAQYSVEHSSSGTVLNEKHINKIQQQYQGVFERFWKTFWMTEPPKIGASLLDSKTRNIDSTGKELNRDRLNKLLSFLWQKAPNLLLLVLEAFLKSEPEPIPNRAMMFDVIQNELAASWLRSFDARELSAVELQLCGVLRMFLTPTLIMDGNTYPFSVKQWSDDVGSRSSLGGGVALESIGNDPFFELLTLDDFPSAASCWVWLSLQVPCSGLVQLYYTTTEYPDFVAEKMRSVNLLAGEQTLSFLIDDPDFTGKIRLDPGAGMGVYLIRHLSLYVVN